jgi:hypothetical protein
MELRSPVSVEQPWEAVFPSRATLTLLGAWPRVRKHERPGALPRLDHSLRLASSKRNDALDRASRIENAYLSCTKSSAGFRVADGLIFLKKHRFNAYASKIFQPQRCGLISMTVIETRQPSAELIGHTSWLILASAIVCKY